MFYYNSSLYYIIALQWLKALVSMFSIINGSRTIINLGPQHPATHGVLRSIAIILSLTLILMMMLFLLDLILLYQHILLLFWLQLKY